MNAETSVDQVIERIKLDLAHMRKTLQNVQISVIRLERELQAWETKKRIENWVHQS